jgi:zinc transporter
MMRGRSGTRAFATQHTTAMAFSYGTRQNGLLCGFRFVPGAGGTPVELADATQWLAPGPGDADNGGFLWLHFDLTDTSALPWMRQHLPLQEEFFEALRQGSRSTRIEDAQDQLVAVINDVAYEFAFDPSEIATLWMSVDRRIAVSARAHPLRSIDRLREAVKQGTQFSSSVDLLNHLLKDQGDVLTRIVREATLKVDGIEDSLLHGRPKHQRTELGKLRRVLVRLQRLLAPEPAAMFRLLRQPPPWVAESDLDELRQATEEFSLVIRDLGALQERIKLLQEEIAAQVSEQTNRSLFTLTMVTVLALPINITTGFFGMNVGGIPFADYAHGFLVVVLLVALFTGIAGWLAFRRKD